MNEQPAVPGPEVSDLSAEANEEQLFYAKILARGMYLGLAMLLVTLFYQLIDFQLQRALDLLEGVALFDKKA